MKARDTSTASFVPAGKGFKAAVRTPEWRGQAIERDEWWDWTWASTPLPGRFSITPVRLRGGEKNALFNRP
jgi:hypothetical protein